ncbi:hypothetical protein GCM10029976_023380 [Kribbella albertanoniae]
MAFRRLGVLLLGVLLLGVRGRVHSRQPVRTMGRPRVRVHRVSLRRLVCRVGHLRTGLVRQRLGRRVPRGRQGPGRQLDLVVRRVGSQAFHRALDQVVRSVSNQALGR